jgi:hypothetical protein
MLRHKFRRRMPTRKKKASSPKKIHDGGAKPSGLPAALVKRATALAAGKKARLAGEGEELLALIQEKRDGIAAAFYDIGLALKRLKDPEMIRALGAPSFAALCDSRAGFSAAFADQLIGVVEHMTRREAIAMGQSKAIAMVSLADATPGADSPSDLFEQSSVTLPSGKRINPRKASVRKIERAARELRHSRGSDGRAHRGRSTTADERAYAVRLEERLRRAGLERATVEAVATKPGQIADLRIAHVPIDSARALAHVLSKA